MIFTKKLFTYLTDFNVGQMTLSYLLINYHVIASYAVICAFSIIEEIGLEIRSSAAKQRFIKEGENSLWNPIIYNETDNRLKEIGLSASYNFHWVERGAETEVQKDIKPKLGVPVYPDHLEIRDVNVELIEAIHRCSIFATL